MRKKRAFRNIVTAIGLQLVLTITNFIIPRLIIANYGSSINGLITSITQFLSYIALSEAGVGGVIIASYYKPIADKDEYKISQVYYESVLFFRKIAIGSALYVIFLLAAYPAIVHTEYDGKFIAEMIAIISMNSFVQYIFGINNQLILQADQRVYIVNSCKIIFNLVNTLLLVVLVKKNVSILWVKLVSTLILIAIPLSYYFYVKKHYSISSRVERDNNLVKQKWDGLAQHIAAFIHGNTDVVVLSIFSGVKEVSVYAVYMLIINGLKSILSTFPNGVSAIFGNMIANKEWEELKRKYAAFDYFNMLMVTLVFTVASVMSLPFVRIYTSSVKDANYVRPLFAIIILMAEAIYCIRNSYSCIVYAAGHYRQTMKDSYVEAVINVIISLLAVKKFGLVGVAAGTLAAMAYRSIKYIGYLSKNIICWNIWKVIYRYILCAVSVMVIRLSVRFIDFSSIKTISAWIGFSIIVTIISFIEVFCIHWLMNKHEVKEIYKIYIKPLVKRFFN